MRGNLITIKIRDEEVYRKCKLLFRMNSVIIETLLKILFERVDIVDIQRAYIEGDVEGVRKLIRKRLEGGDVVRAGNSVKGSEVDVNGDGVKKEEYKGKRVKVKERLDTGSFW